MDFTMMTDEQLMKFCSSDELSNISNVKLEDLYYEFTIRDTTLGEDKIPKKLMSVLKRKKVI